MNFQKPENALRRAQELILLSQPDRALEVLQQTIVHRKFRAQVWSTIQEKIMLQFIHLCVDQNKLQSLREGLHQYRTVAQVVNALSLGKVFKELRDRVEEKLEQAKEKYGTDKILTTVGDLEAQESPESMMNRMLTSDAPDETLKALHASLKMCWDVYIIILDILRATPKQEKVYHETAIRGFEFCKANIRPQEFKRLCEVIRNHYSLQQKYRGKADYESMLRPDLHIETRLAQLKVSSDLGLWKDAYQTAEEMYALGIHELLQSVGPSKPNLGRMIRAVTDVYYEKLAQVFWVADLPLFHAHASLKYLIHNRTYKKDIESEKLEIMCSSAVLAVLSIPHCQTDQKIDNQAQCDLYRRLASLLNHPAIPTRESFKLALLRLQTQRSIMCNASEAVQLLYKVIEVQEVDATEIANKCSILMAEIVNDPKSAKSLAQYIEPIKRVVFHKIISQLSEVYSAIKISYFIKYVCPESFIPWDEAEKIIVNLAFTGLIDLRINYLKRAIVFSKGTADSEVIYREYLIEFGQQIGDIVAQIDSVSLAEERCKRRERFYEDIEYKISEEVERLKKRNVDVKYRHRVRVDEERKLADTKKKLEKERQEQEERLETLRRTEEQKKREQSRRKEEQNKEKLETAEAILEELKKLQAILQKSTTRGKEDDICLVKGVPLTSVDVDKIASGFMAYEDFETVQKQILIREQQDKLSVRRQQAKRIDHLLRALLEEELPLLDEWEAGRVESDEEAARKREEVRQSQKALLLQYEKYIEDYQRPLKEASELQLQARKEAEMINATAKLKADKILRAKERKTAVLESERKEKEERIAREEEERAADEAEEERIEKEEQERVAREEEEEKAAIDEKIAKEAQERRGQIEEKNRKEEDERNKKLKHQADIQREKQREIEERQERERNQMSDPPLRRNIGGTRDDGSSWRRSR